MHVLKRIRIPATLAALALTSIALTSSAQAVDFEADIRPILKKHCQTCHGGVKRAGGLSLLSRESALSVTDSGEKAIHPGDPDKSPLIARVTSSDESQRMPPPEQGPALSADEISALRQWIAEGAHWTEHWAYRAPVAAPLPLVKKAEWVRQDLDRFILHKLEEAGLDPAPAAERRAWLRRVSFDLTGLPPTLDEMRDFLADDSELAFEKVVDRLLASKAYGERWATVWLDLARYADTVGYERDPTRAIWPWRDWVVNAYNDDLTYDEFLTKQLAGDLLPDATLSDQVATAFHRNSQTNTEDGTDDEEFRNVALMDRINTTWEGLMSTSFRCVQCHSHPYDPFDHAEFYRFAAIFNTTQDNDSAEDFPHLDVPVNPADWSTANEIDREYHELRQRVHTAGTQLSSNTPWMHLKASLAESTGPTTMSILEVDGIPEITATGNVKLGGVFTLEFPVAAGQLTALRIEALPFDLEKAATSSELGFVLSHIKTQLVTGSTTSDLALVAAFDEDPSSFYAAEASLSEDLAGWSAYPRFNRPRRVVFAFEHPIELEEGAKLRLTLEQKAQSSGIIAQVIRRARYSMSNDSAWPALVQQQATARQRLSELKSARDALASVRVPVMREQHASQRRDSRLFRRGSFLTPTDLVTPGIPAVLGDAVINNRLDFARWLTRVDHPLTSRSAVNRVWEQLFGRGLAEVVEDFGSISPPPTHPELLDWMAVRFATTLGWSQKRLLREIVLSATYRQDATVTNALRERDPQNRFYSRGPRIRLTAEMIRDQALAASGLLSRKTGGTPVMPLQPEGIWRTVYNASKWETSPGEDAHRRSLYTFIRRTSGYPSYQIFDAPTREVCTVRRISTNTPLQALVTLNDPIYIEAAAALGEIMRQSENEVEGQIGAGYERVVGQPIPPEALTPLVHLYNSSLEKFHRNPEMSKGIAPSPESAAMAVVSNVLLNLDVSLTK